jgi:hypothetical protein
MNSEKPKIRYNRFHKTINIYLSKYIFLECLDYKNFWKDIEMPELPNLKKLICRFTTRRIPNLPKLEYLDCMSVQQLPDLPNLRILTCKFSQITDYSSFKNLRYLDCAYSSYDSENENKDYIIYGLDNLQFLNCSNRKEFRQIILPNLKVLNCNYSGIKNIICPNLRILSCCFCNITWDQKLNGLKILNHTGVSNELIESYIPKNCEVYYYGLRKEDSLEKRFKCELNISCKY